MVERQAALEARMKELGLPLFGPWEQVAPLSDNLSVVQAPEQNPTPGTQYSLWLGGVGTWQPMPHYVDGYPQTLRTSGIRPDLVERKPTVCLARTIIAEQPATIPVYLGCDGGFVLWLNGKSLLLSDARTETMQPGQEVVELPLQKGENRLVLKIRLDRLPCRFFFLPDYGEERTDQLLAELERQFPQPASRPAGYRQRASISATATEGHFYRLTEIPVPDGIFLEGGGLGFLPDGRLAVGTRRGYVYLVEQATSDDPTHARFALFASGLHEVLGLHVSPPGDIDVVQRGSLVRLRDRDGDGRADTFRNLNNEWGLSGNYHEYTLDLERDPDGNYYTALGLSEVGGATNVSLAPFRGWIVQITPDGRLVPWCFGLRCANGLGWNAAGDLFASDNQGQWVAASPLYHIRRDHFYGNPASKASLPQANSDEARRRAELPPTPPAVWIPYVEFCMSATDIVCDASGGQFGPFTGQLFVGDMMKGTIIRVALEKVEGEYQGACFLFRRGVGAVNRMTFGPDGRLYLARAARGWGGGGRGEGLARLEFTGQTPLEIADVRLLPDAFELRFTLPLAADAESLARDIRLEQFRYHYWAQYGSPKVDREPLPLRHVVVSPDRRRLTIFTRGLKAGRVCHLVLPRFFAAAGQVLLHPDAFYTVNWLRTSDQAAGTPKALEQTRRQL
jgi:glucose/arabinose dehydrogenase